MGLSEPASPTSDWLRCPRPREPRSLSPRGNSCLSLLSRSNSGLAWFESNSTGDSPNGTSARTSACRPRRGCCLRDRRSGSIAPTSSSRFVCGTRLECVSVADCVKVASRISGSCSIRVEISSTVTPHILGFDFRLLGAPDFETLFVSDEVFNETVDLGSTS